MLLKYTHTNTAQAVMQSQIVMMSRERERGRKVKRRTESSRFFNPPRHTHTQSALHFQHFDDLRAAAAAAALPASQPSVVINLKHSSSTTDETVYVN